MQPRQRRWRGVKWPLTSHVCSFHMGDIDQSPHSFAVQEMQPLKHLSWICSEVRVDARVSHRFIKWGQPPHKQHRQGTEHHYCLSSRDGKVCLLSVSLNSSRLLSSHTYTYIPPQSNSYAFHLLLSDLCVCLRLLFMLRFAWLWKITMLLCHLLLQLIKTYIPCLALLRFSQVNCLTEDYWLVWKSTLWKP